MDTTGVYGYNRERQEKLNFNFVYNNPVIYLHIAPKAARL